MTEATFAPQPFWAGTRLRPRAGRLGAAAAVEVGAVVATAGAGAGAWAEAAPEAGIRVKEIVLLMWPRATTWRQSDECKINAGQSTQRVCLP